MQIEHQRKLSLCSCRPVQMNLAGSNPGGNLNRTFLSDGKQIELLRGKTFSDTAIDYVLQNPGILLRNQQFLPKFLIHNIFPLCCL